MEIQLSVSIALVVAVVAAEVLSTLWYSDNTPWGRHHGDRFLVAAIAADAGLAFITQWIIRNHWSVYKWEDAALLAGCLCLVYACLEAPHCVHNAKSFSRFFFHALHKFAIVFVVAFCLFYFKDY